MSVYERGRRKAAAARAQRRDVLWRYKCSMIVPRWWFDHVHPILCSPVSVCSVSVLCFSVFDGSVHAVMKVIESISSKH